MDNKETKLEARSEPTISLRDYFAGQSLAGVLAGLLGKPTICLNHYTHLRTPCC